MRITGEKVGKLCPCCYREIDLATVENIQKRKMKRPVYSIHTAGRPRFRDDERIHKLRSTGMPLEDIAVELGVSVATVLRGLKV